MMMTAVASVEQRELFAKAMCPAEKVCGGVFIAGAIG